MSVGSTLVRGAEIRFREAAEKLRPFVGCFWVITADRDAVLELIPDGSTTISAQLQDEGAPVWSLRGPLLKPDARRFAAPTTVVGIRLRPGVAFILTGVAMETLVDRRIDLTSITPFRDLVAVEPRPRTPAEHIASLEHFLIERLEHAAIHPVVASVLAELERRRGASAGVRARRPRRRQPSTPESPDAPVGRLRPQAARDHRPLPGDAPRDGAVGPTARWRPWRWRTVISTSLT